MSRNAVRIIPKHRPDVPGISVRMWPKYAKQKYLKEKPKYLMDTSHYGSEKARTEGSKTLENVKEAMSMQFF